MPWSSRWLEAKLDHLCDALADVELEALISYVSSLEVFRWRSSCSGTESPAWVIKDLFTVLERRGLSVPQIVTVAGAETNAQKRSFIMEQSKCMQTCATCSGKTKRHIVQKRDADADQM